MDEKLSLSVSPAKTVRGVAPCYQSSLLFDTKGQQRLTSLVVAGCNQMYDISSTTIIETEKLDLASARDVPQKLTVPDIRSCVCCQITFSDREEQISHFKCDWHRYNLHRKLRGQSGISEDDFENLAVASDVSSISGSDDSDDDDSDEDDINVKQSPLNTIGYPASNANRETSVYQERKLQKVFFKNDSGELISLHRCLLYHKKSPISNAEELVKVAMNLPAKKKWLVVMVSAGHFAAAVFEGKTVLEHKTFHRYTVRAKRGTAQSSRDSQGRAPKSAGARLRRYNEAALFQEVGELMNSWSAHISSCDLIFVRIPVNNRAMLYSGKTPILKKDDYRIRVIPFPTRRPTFSELKRVHQMLASVESYGQESEIGDVIPYSPLRVYVKETNELQIREPRPERKSQNEEKNFQGDNLKNKLADSENTKPDELQPTDKAIQDYAESDKEVADMDLVECMQTVDFTHLKEFESTPNAKKKNKKKKRDVLDKPTETPELDEERMRWLNKLFTACKTGNLELLHSLVAEINTSTTSVESNALAEENSIKHITDNVNGASNSQAFQQNTEDLKSISLGNNHNSSEKYERHANSEQVLSDTTEHADNLVKPNSEQEMSNNTALSGNLIPLNPDGEDGTQPGDLSTSPSSLLQDVLNKPVGDQGSTFLHVSAKFGHSEVVWALLEAGADPSIKDKSGKTPYGLGETEVRNTFRRFMAKYPEKYNYAKAQVPSPLTADMEAEKRQKNAEKRKQKKKALNERNKEKKATEAKAREENREKDRFLALSDREKRALAAERRFLQQSEQTGARPVCSRCWQCGVDITGKVPFEYADYKFCTTKCLREHRSKAAS